MEIGDRIRIDEMIGVVVALISDGKFATSYPAELWLYLKVGVLVETDQAGLIHYPNLDGIEVDKISD